MPDAPPVILFQSVGTGGPHNPVHEALVYTVVQRRPSVLVQWCSSETVETTASLFDAVLSAAHRPSDVVRLVREDKDDVEALARQYFADIRQQQRLHPDARIEVEFTSGTKAMSAAAVLAGIEARAHVLNYATGPRDVTGRAVRTDRVVSLGTADLVAAEELTELARLFDLGQFVAVTRQASRLSELVVSGELRQRAQLLSDMADAYEEWDAFRWRDAFARLRQPKLQSDLAAQGWDAELVGRQVVHLKRCMDHSMPPRPERVVDLLANAKRRLDWGRVDDATARGYRLIEYLAQAQLAARFGITSTRGVSVDRLHEFAPRFVEAELAPRARDGRVDLALQSDICVLHEAGDELGRALMAQYGGPEGAGLGRGPLGKLLCARNDSFLAHGSTPIEPNTARELVEVAQSLVRIHVEARGASFESIRDVAVFARPPR